MHGTPAGGMAVELYATTGAQATLVKRFVLNADGRSPDGPLFDNASLKKGTYRLVFDVAAYFRSRGVQLPDPPFLDRVTLDFGIAHADQHYHVPLLVSPWSYSTYRGS
jgi:5-hydroxyisourate hydrolase